MNKFHIRMLYGYLYNEYSPSGYYWEIIKFVQKNWCNLFLILFMDFLILKGILLITI